MATLTKPCSVALRRTFILVFKALLCESELSLVVVQCSDGQISMQTDRVISLYTFKSCDIGFTIFCRGMQCFPLDEINMFMEDQE